MKSCMIGLAVLLALSFNLVSRAADFDGDGTNDIGIYRESSGLWSVRGVTRIYYGASAEPVPGDYNGDNTVDICVYRSSSGLWSARNVTRIYYGASAEPLAGIPAGSGAWSKSGGDISFITGNVGIGTASPSTALDVSGTITATGGTSSNWNTAYSQRQQWDGSSTNLSAATGRSSLELGTGDSPTFTDLELTGNLELPATTSSTGIIMADGYRFIHNYGAANTFIGEIAGNLTTSGTGLNTAVGKSALSNLTTGHNNLAVGAHAITNLTTGSSNTVIGSAAGFFNQTGDSNIFIGFGAGFYETGSNKLYIANDSGTPLIYGDFSTGRVGINHDTPGYNLTVLGTTWCTSGAWIASDLRWKENIETITNPVDKVMRLRGVNFDWKRDEFADMQFPEGRQMGLISQEVEDILPELVHTADDGYKSISYQKLTAVLVETVKAQQEQISTLQSRIERLEQGEI